MGTIKGVNTIEDLAAFCPGWTPPAPEPKKRGKAKKPTLIEPGIAIIDRDLHIYVPVETKSEANQRQWQAKHRRTGQAWSAVRKAIGANLCMVEPYAKHYHNGGVLRVRFTRVGGRKLDGMANLGMAMKGVEDAVAYMLGCNDGDPRWVASAWQEASSCVGVAVWISCEGPR